MENHTHIRDYNRIGRKERKRRILAWIILLLVFLYAPEIRWEDIPFFLTTQFLPLLTYEQEYGKQDAYFAANYEVPEWFYEDEGQTVMTETVEEETTSDAVKEANAVTTVLNQSIGTVYTREQLGKQDFLLNNIFVVDSNTNMTEEELSLDNLLDTDLSVADLIANPAELLETGKSKEMQRPYKVLIYHTHGSESFIDSRPGVTEDTIIGVGDYLTSVLETKYGISVYHDRTAYDVIDGVLDRNSAYENAYDHVSQILKENPSIEVVIDLHRDGLDEDMHLITEVNGKPTAKIMFLNGVSRSNLNGDIAYLNNPNKLQNLAFSFQLYLKGKELYGDYVRKIYVKSLRFNLHLLPRATLIEAGAQTNTLEEEKNAMEPLAEILYQVLSKQE